MVLLNSLGDTYRMLKVALRTHEGLTFERVSARLREAEMELEPTEKKKNEAEESAYVSNQKTEKNFPTSLWSICIAVQCTVHMTAGSKGVRSKE